MDSQMRGIITVRDGYCAGDRWRLQVETYASLREVVTSSAFLKITKLNPNGLIFSVDGRVAADDLLIVPGDEIVFVCPSRKALIPPAEVVKKLQKRVGLHFERHGGRHDQWRTSAGRRVTIPRHAAALTPGTLRTIIRQAGLEMGSREFLGS